jgi:class I fructose-bisphosphate aldolase
VEDALRLGCAAIGFTIYPGSSLSLEMFEDIAEMRKEAAMKGVATVIWSYPRGEDLDKHGETAVDVTAYAAHIAALLGAHVIKVKLPTEHVSQAEARKVYDSEKIDVATQAARVRHIVQACLGGRRLVVFSGGAAKGDDSVIQDARDILAGGGNGSIIGRNVFQRPRAEAIALLNELMQIYRA